MTAAALVTACSSSPTVVPTESPSFSKTPGVEKVVIPTAQETLTRLAADPEVKTSEKVLSFTDLKKQILLT